MAFGIRFSASALAVVIGAGIAPGSFTPPPADVSTFTVTTVPSDPYVGEAVRVRIEGAGGHSATNNLRDIWVQTDVGESGATFTTGATQFDAETAYGRYFAHCYASAGSKTMTVSSWTFDSATKTQTFGVTITDPDAETWDTVYWVDFNGSTTGMPANDATNTRILSWAAWTAEENVTTSTDKIRVRFRGSGTTHTTGAVNNWSQQAAVVYVDTFGGGRATIADGSGTFGDYEMFAPRAGASAPRWIIRDIDFVGSYDPVTGSFNGNSKFAGFNTNAIIDTSATFWRCTATGHESLGAGSGSQFIDYRYQMAYIDCNVSNWQNYGLGFTGASNLVVARGSKAIQHPAAGMGDAKIGVDPEYADHGPIRVSRYIRGGISQCELRSNNGWSPLSPTQGIQPAIRIYMNENETNTEFVVLMNELSGRYILQYGHASSDETITNPSELLVACNSFDASRQGAFGLQCHTGGFHMFSNVIYIPNISSARSAQSYIIAEHDAAFDSAANTSQEAYEKPSYVGFNTYFSDATTSLNHGASAISETVEDTIGGYVPQITKAGNQISGDGNAGTYIAASAFARGDNFRPITAGAAVSTVTTGPPTDFNGVKRTNPTNEGAHHVAGSDVSVSAVTNSVAPTIAALAKANEYGVTDIGTWSDTQHWMLEFNWKVDGSPAPDTSSTHIPTFVDATTGNLTCDLVRTNRSGVRTSATSNTIAI